MKVRMFCDWGDSSEELINRLKAQTDNFDGYDYRGMNFVFDDTYDHAICFNFPDYKLLSPPENNVALILEPPELVETMFREQRKKNYKNVREIYAFSVARREYTPAFALGFSTIPPKREMFGFPDLTKKSKKICMIASDKLMTPYHRKRQDIRAALMATDLPIDFYGRGMQTGNDPRIKGEIASMAKYRVLQQYQICIDYENSPHSAVTDKFFDPVLCNTMPVTNAAILYSYADQDSFFYTSFDLPVSEIVRQIEEICETDIELGHQLALADAKHEIRAGSMSLANWIYERVTE